MNRPLLVLLLLASIAPALAAQKFTDLAPTPPMGWNSWNVFRCDIDEAKIRGMADAMVQSGMRDVGYEYLIIDDCWQGERDSLGRLTADPAKFPSGMRALAEYVHARGLKFGIYSDAGDRTCGGYPGSRGHEYQDARTFASWGVDYLKYDWCYVHEEQSAEASYHLMSQALRAAGRPVILSICEWGSNQPGEWAAPIGHLWRTTVDIVDCYDCETNWGGLGVLQIIDRQLPLRLDAGPHAWNDPDMLEIGNEGLSLAECRTQMSMWAMLAAPLLAGNDLRTMTPAIRDVLTNPAVIAIDQDSLGQGALKFLDYGDREIWFRPLTGGDYAFCFLNRSAEPWTVDHVLSSEGVFDLAAGRKFYPIRPGRPVRDLWTGQELPNTDVPLDRTIQGHDVLLVRVTNGGD